MKCFTVSFHSLLFSFAVSPLKNLVFSSTFKFSISFLSSFLFMYFSIGFNESVFSPFPRCESIITLFFFKRFLISGITTSILVVSNIFPFSSIGTFKSSLKIIFLIFGYYSKKNYKGGAKRRPCILFIYSPPLISLPNVLDRLILHQSKLHQLPHFQLFLKYLFHLFSRYK